MSLPAILLPLSAALIYVLGTLFVKKASAAGAGSRQVNIVVNCAMGLIMFPLWFLPSSSLGWWQPALCGLLFFGGQCLTFTALSRGDVSVATPLMGTKILFVSGFVLLLSGGETSLAWWAAVALACLSTFLITLQPDRHSRKHVAQTALFAVSSAVLFGLTDALIQTWCHTAIVSRFLAIMFSVNAAVSVAWYVAANPRDLIPPAACRPALLVSGSLFAVQVLLLGLALGIYNNAPMTNILYSSRSLWSVLLASSVGHWFGARDREAGRRVTALRLCGAGLLCLAIFLIVHS